MIHKSVGTITLIPERVAAFREVFHQDDPPAAARWLLWPRSELAFAISRLGAAVMRVGSRLDPDAPNGSGAEAWTAGYGVGRRVGYETAREDLVPGIEEENESL